MIGSASIPPRECPTKECPLNSQLICRGTLSYPLDGNGTTRLTRLAKRRIESGSAEKLWEDGYDSEVVLTESQQRIRDAYGFRRVAWYGDNGLWAGALVAAVFTIPWLWYFALDRLRELSAAVQGRSG